MAIPPLDELRTLAQGSTDFLMQLQKQERERTGLASLKIGYNKVHGFFIEISSKQAENAPAEYIRRQTLKNAERFITPELKVHEEKILYAEQKARQIEKAIIEQVIESIQQYMLELQKTVQPH